MDWGFLLALAAVTAAVSFAGTRAAIGYLRRRAILDHPGERSSHEMPTPRGAGLAVVPVLVLAWLVAGWQAGGDVLMETAVVTGVGIALAAVSWMDDMRDLSPWFRLACQFAAVAVALAAMPREAPFFAGMLPPRTDVIVAAFLWVWFINLFNFMDGIDGISGIEAGAIGTGVVVVAAVGGAGAWLAPYGAAVVGVAAGFLWWNWHPARVFLGDVGSTGIGFLLGWLLLSLSTAGQWAAALIIPAVYLADATITLLGRAVRREKLWQAHREHFYQKGVQGGLSHARVAGHVLAANVVLIVCAAGAAAGDVAAGLAGAAATVLVLLGYFATRPARRG